VVSTLAVVVLVVLADVVVGIAVGAGTVNVGNNVVVFNVVTGGKNVIVCWVVAGGKKVVSGAGRVVRDTTVLVDAGGLQAVSGSNRRTTVVSPRPTLTPTFDMHRIITLSTGSQPIGNFC
jgi:hypothetical protein